MKIAASTKITFPGNATSGQSKILFFKKMPEVNKLVIITESTPFHPVDYNWPDQPDDKGTLTIEGKTISVLQCVTAALHPQTEELLLDQEIKNIKIRRDDPNWYFLVAHIVDANLLTDNLIGKDVLLEIDTNYRYALSKSHSACHLAALALNKVTAVYWRKPTDRKDSFDNPSLDAEAIVESKISDQCSVDRYRCGKSLRKKGFDDVRFFSDEEFKRVEELVNKQLSEWCASGLKINVTPAETFLHERREWRCIFPDGREASIPCGGTHVTTVTSNDNISVTFKRDGDAEFVMMSRLAKG